MTRNKSQYTTTYSKIYTEMIVDDSRSDSNIGVARVRVAVRPFSIFVALWKKFNIPIVIYVYAAHAVSSYK